MHPFLFSIGKGDHVAQAWDGWSVIGHKHAWDREIVWARRIR